MNTPHRCVHRGFTVIELMTVLVIAGVLLSLAIPSFRELLARNRVEGVAAELSTDLQYARSEAVSRNVPVGLIAGANCYTVFVVGTTPATSCTTLGTGGVSIKAVTIDVAATSLAFASNGGQAFIQFDPVRGMATDAGGANDWSGFVNVSTTVGNWQLRADVTNFGRAKACSPSGTFKGYPSC